MTTQQWPDPPLDNSGESATPRTSTYEAWRISYQDSEQACRALWRENAEITANNAELSGMLSDANKTTAELRHTLDILCTVIRTGAVPPDNFTDDDIVRKTAIRAVAIHKENERLVAANNNAVLMIQERETELAGLRVKLEASEKFRTYIDAHTTFYNVDADWPVEGHNIPVLAQVSERIWYHATDDISSYPFSAAIDAALATPAQEERSGKERRNDRRKSTTVVTPLYASPPAPEGKVTWENQALAYLGYSRDSLPPEHVRIIQDFIVASQNLAAARKG